MSLEQTQQQLEDARNRLQTWQQDFKKRAGIAPDLLHDIFDSPGACIEVVGKNYYVAGYEMQLNHDYGNDFNYDEFEELGDEGPEEDLTPEEPFEATETISFARSWPKRSVRPAKMILTYEAGTDYKQLREILFHWDGHNPVLSESLSMPAKGDWVLNRATRPGVLFPGPKQIAERLVLPTDDTASMIVAAMATSEAYTWNEPGISRARAALRHPAAQHLRISLNQTDGKISGWKATLGFANRNLLELGFVDGKRVSVMGKFSGSDPEAAVYQSGNQTFLIPRTLDPGVYLETVGKLRI